MNKKEALELYFSDLKRLFLKKYEVFCVGSTPTEHQVKALLDLIEEIVYVKKMLDTVQ